MKRIGVIILITIALAGGAGFFMFKKTKGVVLSSSVKNDYSALSQPFVFTSNRDGNNEVYLADKNGGNQSRITNTSDSSELMAALSPDQKSIAYFVKNGGYFGLWLHNLAVKTEMPLAIARSKPSLLKFSPNSLWLGYLEASGELYAVNLTNGRVERIGGKVNDFCWSQNSREIVYTSKNENEGIVLTGLNVVTLLENGISDPARIFQGGVAPVYLKSAGKILFLDARGEYLIPTLISLRGENPKELFALKYRPRENTDYYLLPENSENEILMQTVSGQINEKAALINLEKQTSDDLPIASPKLLWGSDGKVIFNGQNDKGVWQIWSMGSNDLGATQLTDKGDNLL